MNTETIPTTTTVSVTGRDAFFLLLTAYFHKQECWEQAKQTTTCDAVLTLTGLVERFVDHIKERCPVDYERLKESPEAVNDLSDWLASVTSK